MSPTAAPLTSFLAGRWQPAQGQAIERENPGRAGEIVARWCAAGQDEARAAVEAATDAANKWAEVPLPNRAKLLSALLEEVSARAEDFAAVIVRENGKLMAEARAEVSSALADARHALAEAARLGSTEAAPVVNPDVRSETRLEPLGVCLLVTPWNFPLATVLRKLVPALLWGNAAIVKPSELTPGPAVALFRLLEKTALPPGLASLVLGAGDVGATLAAQPAVRAISFTGSTDNGRSLAQLTAGREVRLQLEMGGKNSLVVLADADLDLAVAAALTAGLGCAGQWCTGTGRVIVARTVQAEFVERLAAAAARLVPGPGDDESSTLGPVISATRLAAAQAAVRESTRAGARVRCGGRARDGGHFFEATVLDHVREEMPCFTEELFVPVLPVAEARDAADALRLANTGRLGLSASVFSRDPERAATFAARIEAGIAHVNLHTAYREPALPVAGWRDSGRGLPECGRFARDFFTRARALYVRR